MIKIDGLTPEQVEICDMLWSMDSVEEIRSWMDSLPPEIQHEAFVLMNMMSCAIIDEALETSTDFTAANEVIARAKQ